MEKLDELKPDIDGVPELMAAIVRGLVSAGELVSDGTLMRDTLALYVRHPMEHADADEPRPITEKAASVLAAAQERGEVRSDITPEAASALIFTSMFGVFAAGAGRGEILHHWTEVVARGLQPI